MSKTTATPHDSLVSRIVHHEARLCESCRRRPARRHSAFCSQACAETFMYYE